MTEDEPLLLLIAIGPALGALLLPPVVENQSRLRVHAVQDDVQMRVRGPCDRSTAPGAAASPLPENRSRRTADLARDVGLAAVPAGKPRDHRAQTPSRWRCGSRVLADSCRRCAPPGVERARTLGIGSLAWPAQTQRASCCGDCAGEPIATHCRTGVSSFGSSSRVCRPAAPSSTSCGWCFSAP